MFQITYDAVYAFWVILLLGIVSICTSIDCSFQLVVFLLLFVNGYLSEIMLVYRLAIQTHIHVHSRNAQIHFQTMYICIYFSIYAIRMIIIIIYTLLVLRS